MKADSLAEEYTPIVLQVKIAEHIIELHIQHAHDAEYFEKYRLPDNCTAQAEFVAEATEEDCLQIYNRMLGEGQRGTDSRLVYVTLESLSIQKQIADALLKDNTLLMHGSVIATEGFGYMFMAPSGVGKTTRTRIWLKCIPNSIVVNGDKPFVHIANDSTTVYGTPWCGKEGWNQNISVPLQAIFLLERTEEGEEDHIEELRTAQAVLDLARQTYQPEGERGLFRVMKLLQVMLRNVKCYRLRCAPTEEAVRLAWKTARP